MSLGRGAGVNKPAWMTKEDFHQGDDTLTSSSGAAARRSRSRSRDRDDHRSSRREDDDYDHRRDRRRDDRRHHGRGGRDDRRGGRRGGGGNRSGIYFHSYEEERSWLAARREKRLTRPKPFDVQPTPQQLAEEEARSQYNSLVGGTLHSSNPSTVQPTQTRHARRLYVGNIPDGISESQVHDFFRDAIRDTIIIDPNDPHHNSHKSQYVDNDPIISVYINRERRFAFLEFTTMEITSALLEFDGIDVLNRGKVKIKRPNDYNPALMTNGPLGGGVSLANMPRFDTSKIGIVSQTVQDGPNKIFIGGLPYHLVDSQVLELLSAFGAVKAFHLVKNDANAITSKGYCFVEYADTNVTPIAVMGLNGMDMGGGKVLTAKVADPQAGGGGGGTMIPVAAQQAVPANVVDGLDVDALLNAAIGGGGGNVMMQQQQQQVVVTDPLAVANAAASALDMALNGGGGAQPQAGAEATRILVLLNMVMDEDLRSDEDRKFLEEEVREEAGKYGKLLSMKIPRHEDGYAPTAVKKIFLEYETVADACNAEKELKGRAFGPSIVGASYFNEQEYANNILS